jgi:hypothetical protein
MYRSLAFTKMSCSSAATKMSDSFFQKKYLEVFSWCEVVCGDFEFDVGSVRIDFRKIDHWQRKGHDQLSDPNPTTVSSAKGRFD